MGKLGGWIRSGVWGGALGAGSLAAMLLTGCAGFFQAPSSTTSTTTSNSGDYVYVVNNTTNTLGAFNLGTGTLVSIPSGAYTLPTGLAARSVTVSRKNTFVFVGGLGAIECYSVGSGGALTQATGGGATAVADFVSLTTSPDGQWLLALDAESFAVDVYGINASTGALSLNQSVALSSYVPGSATLSASTPPTTLKIAPAGTYVAVALGPSGDALFSFNTTAGSLTSTAGVITPAGFTDNAVQFDSTSSYLFVARGVTGSSGSSSVNSFLIASNGTLSPVQTIASGNAPYSLEMDSSGEYLYAANRGDSSISGYSFTSGQLAALTNSPFKAGTTVTALARDNSTHYVLAAALGGSSDVTMYALDAGTAGQLDDISTAASGNDPAGSVALATTH